MATQEFNRRYEDAKEVAMLILDQEDTEVTEEQIEEWDEEDLYAWLRAWGVTRFDEGGTA